LESSYKEEEKKGDRRKKKREENGILREVSRLFEVHPKADTMNVRGARTVGRAAEQC